MTRIPALTGKELISLLKKADFVIVRHKGSHVFMKHPDGRATVVPIHQGETIGLGLLMKILKDTEISRRELLRLIND